MLSSTIPNLFRAVGSIVREEQGNAASLAEALAIKDEKGIWATLIPDRKQRDDHTQDLIVQADRQVQAMMTRVLKTEQPLSKRIWNSEAIAKGALNRRINSGLARGDSADNIAKDVKDFVSPNTPGGASYRAKMLARTEINNAFHAQSIADAQARPWVEQMNWNLSKSHSEQGCVCEQYAATRLFPVDGVPKKPHPGCFSGEALVSANSVNAITRRWYDGRFVDVFCAEDSPQLSGTPNHPALTRRGWVALSELREGDELVVDRGRVISTSVDVPDDKHIPVRIEDMFESLRVASRVPSASVPASPEQFHRDGSVDGDVDIVWANRFLESFLTDEELSDPEFFFSGAGQSVLFGLGCFNLAAHENGEPSGSIMGSFRHLRSIFEAESGLSISERLTERFEHLANNAEAESGDGRGLAERLSGQVDLLRVTSVVERPASFRGHVYNLWTDEGYYRTNSIITHNCLCTVTPELPDLDTVIKAHMSAQYQGYLPGRGMV